MKVKKGVTLIELLIVLVIVAIGLVAVISFLYASWKDWYTNKEIKELQEDMDIASLNIKAVAEEANYYEIQDIIEGSIPEEGRRLYVRYTEDEETIWEKDFYPDSNNLIMGDIKNEREDVVIRTTLQDIKFSEASEEDTTLTDIVKVDIKVYKSGRILENIFYVKMRNR
ncbi:MAG: prepilin-type N-terminal cleavage/methylation domain-containing protein [Candidatus Omnitrophica bacterium]|nr:prepilin-type N-terminal cleavage/methylation domain-containing protein [Candidatus Omnitrophota bacterium]